MAGCVCQALETSRPGRWVEGGFDSQGYVMEKRYGKPGTLALATFDV